MPNSNHKKCLEYVSSKERGIRKHFNFNNNLKEGRKGGRKINIENALINTGKLLDFLR